VTAPAGNRVIAAFGAYGYGHTARFVVAKLRERAWTPVLSGRDAAKLATIAAGSHPVLERRLASIRTQRHSTAHRRRRRGHQLRESLRRDRSSGHRGRPARGHPSPDRGHERRTGPFGGSGAGPRRACWGRAQSDAAPRGPGCRFGAASSVARCALGPCRIGPTRAAAVTDGSEEPQVAVHPAQAAGMMRAGDSDCGPEGLGSLVGQQMGSNRSA
jgi:hypothetical protein